MKAPPKKPPSKRMRPRYTKKGKRIGRPPKRKQGQRIRPVGWVLRHGPGLKGRSHRKRRADTGKRRFVYASVVWSFTQNGNPPYHTTVLRMRHNPTGELVQIVAEGPCNRLDMERVGWILLKQKVKQKHEEYRAIHHEGQSRYGVSRHGWSCHYDDQKAFKELLERYTDSYEDT